MARESKVGNYYIPDLNGDVSPNGNIIGSRGQLYQNVSGGEIWIKASGNRTATGWEQLATGSGLLVYKTTIESPTGVETITHNLGVEPDDIILFAQDEADGVWYKLGNPSVWYDSGNTQEVFFDVAGSEFFAIKVVVTAL